MVTAQRGMTSVTMTSHRVLEVRKTGQHSTITCLLYRKKSVYSATEKPIEYAENE